MGIFNSFEEIEAWKAGRELTCRIYVLTKRLPFARDWGLKDQICRAAASIMSNIAEGYESQTETVFMRHLGIAKGSAGEVRSQLYVALDQNYISKSEFESLSQLSMKISRQLSRFKEYLERCHPRDL